MGVVDLGLFLSLFERIAERMFQISIYILHLGYQIKNDNDSAFIREK
jgi:hypothetical protein